MKKFLVLTMRRFSPGPNYEHDTGATGRRNEDVDGLGTTMWRQISGYGRPLMNGQVLATGGEVSDSNKDVAGYSVLEADSLQDAEKMLEGHPHISGWNKDATIEVHEMMPLPGM